MHREYRAQVRHRACLELRLTLHRVELDVGLGQAELELARLDRVDVEHRAAGQFDRAADTGLRAVLVHQATNGAADRVVDAGDATSADGDEALLLRTLTPLVRVSVSAAAANSPPALADLIKLHVLFSHWILNSPRFFITISHHNVAAATAVQSTTRRLQRVDGISQALDDGIDIAGA